MNDVLFSHINEPNSKRRDILNLAIENIELIKRTDALKEVRERKVMIMDALKEEISLTHRAIKHFETLMPFKVKEEHEKVLEKVHRNKVKLVQKHKVEKLDNLGIELENIKEKLNNLSF